MSARSSRKMSLVAWLLVAGLAIALLMWLEWLGSEQPVQMIEKPVDAPATKSGSRN